LPRSGELATIKRLKEIEITIEFHNKTLPEIVDILNGAQKKVAPEQIVRIDLVAGLSWLRAIDDFDSNKGGNVLTQHLSEMPKCSLNVDRMPLYDVLLCLQQDMGGVPSINIDNNSVLLVLPSIH